MRSLYYIPPIDSSELIGKRISLVNPRGEREEMEILELVYNQSEDLFQGKVKGFSFSLNRAKMEQIFPKIISQNDLKSVEK